MAKHDWWYDHRELTEEEERQVIERNSMPVVQEQFTPRPIALRVSSVSPTERPPKYVRKSPKTAICESCELPFPIPVTAGGRARKYCSPSCSRKANANRARARKLAKAVMS